MFTLYILSKYRKCAYFETLWNSHFCMYLYGNFIHSVGRALSTDPQLYAPFGTELRHLRAEYYDHNKAAFIRINFLWGPNETHNNVFV